jgi:hypothetical protein
VLCVNADETGGDNSVFQAVTSGLTWTSRVVRGDADADPGYAGIFTAPVTTGASMTIAVNRTGSTGSSGRIAAKVYIVTGQHASPIGTNAEADFTTDPQNLTYTATGAGRAFGGGTDWNANGALTSSDTGSSDHYAGQISVISAYDSADYAAGSGSQGINFNAAGTPTGNLVVLEILAAAAGGGTNTSKTMTETLTVTDQEVDGAIRPRALSESISLTDQNVWWTRRVRLMTDTLDLIDSTVKSLLGAAIVKVMSDTLSLVDSAVQWLRRVRGPIDTITLTDGDRYRTSLVTAEELIELADGFVTWRRLKRVHTDNLDLIDGFAKTLAGASIVYAKVMSDTVTLIDDAGQRWRLRMSQLTEAVGLSDAVIRAILRIRYLGDVVEFADGTVQIKRLRRSGDEVIEVSDERISTLYLDSPSNVRFEFGSASAPFRFGGV